MIWKCLWFPFMSKSQELLILLWFVPNTTVGRYAIFSLSLLNIKMYFFFLSKFTDALNSIQKNPKLATSLKTWCHSSAQVISFRIEFKAHSQGPQDPKSSAGTPHLSHAPSTQTHKHTYILLLCWSPFPQVPLCLFRSSHNGKSQKAPHSGTLFFLFLLSESLLPDTYNIYSLASCRSWLNYHLIKEAFSNLPSYHFPPSDIKNISVFSPSPSRTQAPPEQNSECFIQCCNPSTGTNTYYIVMLFWSI